MSMVSAERVNLGELMSLGDIECECVLCHLPVDEPHGPIEWRLTWRWPGPFPEAGIETMLMCNLCFQDWVDNPESFGGSAESMHKV